MPTIGMMIPTSGYGQAELDRRVRLATALAPSGFEFTIAVPPGAPEFFDRGSDFPVAIGAAGSFVTSFAGRGVDVLIASGAIDPGLDALRATVDVPVVGPGEASLYAASLVGKALSLVTVDEHAVARTDAFLAAAPAKPPIVSVRSIDYPVRQCVQDVEGTRQRLREQCAAAVQQDGASAIYLACMVFGVIDIVDELRQTLQVPVFDPFAIAVDVACQLATQVPRRAA